MVNEHSLLQISYMYLELSYSVLYGINKVFYGSYLSLWNPGRVSPAKITNDWVLIKL